MAFNCIVPNCGARLAAEAAFVPEVAAIRKAEKKSGSITVADLVRHTLCGRHSHAARQQKVKTFRYLDTVKLLENRVATREQETKFLSMYAAFEKAQVGATPAKPSS